MKLTLKKNRVLVLLIGVAELLVKSLKSKILIVKFKSHIEAATITKESLFSKSLK